MVSLGTENEVYANKKGECMTQDVGLCELEVWVRRLKV